MRERITIHDVEAAIAEEQYYVFPGTNLTVCCLTLRNGYSATGESAAISTEEFKPELGKKYSRDKALSKIWLLEGYLLREYIYQKKLFAGEAQK